MDDDAAVQRGIHALVHVAPRRRVRHLLGVAAETGGAALLRGCRGRLAAAALSELCPAHLRQRTRPRGSRGLHLADLRAREHLADSQKELVEEEKKNENVSASRATPANLL